MNKTLFNAIQKEISIGGKFFCWHDWIFSNHSLPMNAWEFTKGIDAEYLCTKCGKRKRDVFAATLTRYDEIGVNLLTNLPPTEGGEEKKQ